MKRYILGITTETTEGTKQRIIEEIEKDVISAINEIKRKKEYENCRFDFIYSEEYHEEDINNH